MPTAPESTPTVKKPGPPIGAEPELLSTVIAMPETTLALAEVSRLAEASTASFGMSVGQLW